MRTILPFAIISLSLVSVRLNAESAQPPTKDDDFTVTKGAGNLSLTTQPDDPKDSKSPFKSKFLRKDRDLDEKSVEKEIAHVERLKRKVEQHFRNQKEGAGELPEIKNPQPYTDEERNAYIRLIHDLGDSGESLVKMRDALGDDKKFGKLKDAVTDSADLALETLERIRKNEAGTHYGWGNDIDGAVKVAEDRIRNPKKKIAGRKASFVKLDSLLLPKFDSTSLGNLEPTFELLKNLQETKKAKPECPPQSEPQKAENSKLKPLSNEDIKASQEAAERLKQIDTLRNGAYGEMHQVNPKYENKK